MRHILAIFVVALLFGQTVAFAETKEIITEGTYNMGDGETPTVAESRAMLQAKRTAVEEAGTYVESYSKTRNFQLTVDEIQVLASGVMEVEVLEKKRTVVGDGFNFWIKIKARVSTDKMEEMAKRVKEKSVVEDFKKIQEAYDKSQKDIEELKRQLAGAKSAKEKKQIAGRITDEERFFQASEWIEKGYNHSANNEYDKAIEAYTKAMAVDPGYAKAYNNRGAVYGNKGQYDRAIEDFNKAIALNPNYAAAYNNRGIAYSKKGQDDRATENFNKASALNPDYADVSYNHGIAYSNIGQNGKKVLAIVNGAVLTMADFEKERKKLPEYIQASIETIEGKNQFLDNLVVRKLIIQRAEKAGMDKNKNVMSKLEEIKKTLMIEVSQENKSGTEKDAAVISKLEEIKKTLIIEALLKKEIEGKTAFTGKEAESYYNSHKDEFKEGEKVKIGHIMVKTEKEAKDILEKLKKEESFERLAKKYSVAPTAASGGNSRYIERGMVIPEFEKEAFALKKVGDMSPVFTAAAGFHIVKLLDRQDAEAQPFEKVKDKIIETQAKKKQKDLFEDFISSLKKEAKLTINYFKK